MVAHNKTLKGINALVMGLGLHGGGVATAKWLLNEGAVVTATDKRSSEVLAPSLRALRGKKVAYVLGEHRKSDFRSHDLVVVNPGVPRESEYLVVAKKAKKRIENDTSLFFRYDDHIQIAVTGTRGKTTTTQFIAELLAKKYPLVRPSGNTPANALLAEFTRIKGKHVPVVAELSSWQLEYLPSAQKAPHIAVITNLFPDHLNRYRDISDYADAKANIFHDQEEGDFLILNKQNKWTGYFLKKKPKGSIFYTSTAALKGSSNGIYIKNDVLIFRADSTEQRLFSTKRFVQEHGVHNLENLMAAILAVKLFDPTIVVEENDVLRLSFPVMRQEEVYKKGRVKVVNDSCATSPDGTIAALLRFHKDARIILIAGGTDKSLEYAALAKTIKQTLTEEQVVLLDGSGTHKLHEALRSFNPSTYDTLSACVDEALIRTTHIKKGNVVLLFSPGAASFEKFLHEFDRGAQFNKLVKKYFK